MALAGASPLKELTPAIRIDNPLPEDFLRVRHTFLVVPLKPRPQAPRFYLHNPLCLKLLSFRVSIIERQRLSARKMPRFRRGMAKFAAAAFNGIQLRRNIARRLRELIEFGGIKLSEFAYWFRPGFLVLCISFVSLAREKQ